MPTVGFYKELQNCYRKVTEMFRQFSCRKKTAHSWEWMLKSRGKSIAGLIFDTSNLKGLIYAVVSKMSQITQF